MLNPDFPTQFYGFPWFVIKVQGPNNNENYIVPCNKSFIK